MNEIRLKIGDRVPYKSTSGKIDYAVIESFYDSKENGKEWFWGINERTGRRINYPVHASIRFQQKLREESFYLVSLKNTKKGEAFITLWRPYFKGYTYYIGSAGIYTYDEAISLKSSEVKMIPQSKIMSFLENSFLYDERGDVIINNKINRKKIGFTW